jgi:hypothetical protein
LPGAKSDSFGGASAIGLITLVQKAGSWCISKRSLSAIMAAFSSVFSVGLYCFRSVMDAGCEHVASVTDGGRKSVQLSTFKWVNTVSGTFHAIRENTYLFILQSLNIDSTTN